MRVIFIRHAIAEDRLYWSAPDSQRPLTVEGKEKLKKVSRAVSKLASVDKIISSDYLRAKETAEILQDDFRAEVLIDKRLGLGAEFNDFYEIYEENIECESIMFVGHEPDFSEVIAEITGDGSALVRVKKASFIEVEVDINFRGELLNLIAPKAILKLSESTH